MRNGGVSSEVKGGPREATDLPDGRWWIVMVTFERLRDDQDVLGPADQGACGWMIALAPDEEAACALIVRDLEYRGLRVLEIENEREVFSDKEIAEVDEHLAYNFRNIKGGKQTVWGTIHCYAGDGET
jgi:hypothetical protein